MTHHLTQLDYTIILAYLAASVILGLWFTGRQKSADGYFIANRSAPWWAVGVSVIATNFSAISYLGAPAWLMEHDLQLDMYVLFVPLILPLVAYVFFPFLARLRVISIYEYLERRFGIGARMLGSSLFLLLRGGWLATAIYTQSLMIAPFVSLPVPACVLLIGSATALYTVWGGIEGVIWTDFMQFFVLVGGLVAIIFVILGSFHGDLPEMLRIASQGGHTRMFDFNPSLTQVNFWAVLIGLMVGTFATYGSDQVNVQRLLTSGSERQVRRSLYFTGLLTIPVVVLLDLAGLALVSFYAQHPELRSSMGSADNTVPHFVQRVLPSGLAGLVVAAVLAATMSSLSSGFNSLSAITVVDFYRRFKHQPAEAVGNDLHIARWATIGWAGVTTLAALSVGKLGTIIQICGTLNGWFTGPLLGMFLLGLLTRRGNSPGALIGATVGLLVTWWATTTSLHWLWYAPVGCAAASLAGYLVSLLSSGVATADTDRLTIWHAGATGVAPIPAALPMGSSEDR